MRISTPEHRWRVVALYRFFRTGEPPTLRAKLLSLCTRLGVKGTLIVASEGMNGTVAGSADAIDRLVAFLGRLEGFAGAQIRYSTAEEPPFRRLKIRVKKEIVTMGVPGIGPTGIRGDYIEPKDWNALIADPETILIDTRNAYETAIGTFQGAVDPETGSFREFPGWADSHRDRLEGRKVAMYCTGGIRCEKATAYVKSLGIDRVFHLKGGILKYLDEIPARASRWNGECFVFDERVAVAHGLERGEARLCRACRRPLTPEERRSAGYVEGISCPHCVDERGDADRKRYAQRQMQIERVPAAGEEAHPLTGV